VIKVLIIGLGNVLMSDDGLGVIAVKELKKRNKRYDGINYLDVGTSVLNYITDIGNSKNLIAIDAITAGYPPGTIYRINNLDMINHVELFSNSHGCSLPEAVALSRELTSFPDRVIIYGIQPYRCDFGINISPEVKESLLKLTMMVEREIHSFMTLW
jgi:hydrogenase maturation protease